MTAVLASAPPHVARPPARSRGRTALLGWARRAPLLPALLFTIVVTQIPFLLTLFYSFEKYNLNYPLAPRNFPTVANYEAIFSDPVFRTAALNTLLLTLVPVLLSVLFGVGIAVLLHRHVFGRGLLRTLIISPFLVMPTAAALVWKFSIVDTNVGVLNYLLHVAGLARQDWLGVHAQMTIIAFLTWEWTPFIVLLALAGLQSQDDDVIEAARMDGAGPWRIFRHLTLSHLRPYIELGVLLGTIYIVQAYDSIYVMTAGGPSTDTTNLPYYVYENAFQAYDIGRASALSVIVVVGTIIVATFALRMVSSLFRTEGVRS